MRRQRSGFTLVELLVAITVIAALTALVAAGLFQVIEGQRQTNTESEMRTLQQLLHKQMKAVTDRAKSDKEKMPPGVWTMAGGDPVRARVIWQCLRLKQEFPMTFAEAREPWKNYAGSEIFVDPPANTVKLLTQADLPSLYATALASAPATVNTTAQPFLESSTCLLLAIQQNRGAGTLSADQLKSFAIDTNGDGLKELVDTWNNPLAFFRWPTASDELDATNPATGSALKFRNPLDPEGKLTNIASWNNYSTRYGVAATPLPMVYWFEQLCFNIHVGNSPPTYQPWSRYMLGMLASSGRNGKWGLNTPAAMGPLNLNTDFSIDTGVPSSHSDDNIYSFRLGTDKRGD